MNGTLKMVKIEGGGRGGSRGREYMCAYGWFMLLAYLESNTTL